MMCTETPAQAHSGAELGTRRLHVAIVTAALGFAGAEKQTFYMARALSQAGVRVRVYHLMDGGQYRDQLTHKGIELEWLGRVPSPFLRLPFLIASLRSFRPDVIQSVHAYTNLYSAVAGSVLGAVSIGGLRSDYPTCLADTGRLTRFLLTWPDAIAANSRRALEEIVEVGLSDPRRLHFLPNAIDLTLFQDRDAIRRRGKSGECTYVTVGRLLPLKRVDVFVRALAEARSRAPGIRGIVVGDGPEAENLKKLASQLGLAPGNLDFLGFREDIAAILEDSDVFAFCSESEGTPNVILEAMAARLPVITTPAGDAADIVEPAGAGYVVPFGDVDATAAAMVRLANAPGLRRKLGQDGRDSIARLQGCCGLAARLIKIYADVARTRPRHRDILERVLKCEARLARGAGISAP